MEKIFEFASQVSTPLALGGLIASILFFLLRQIIKKDIFPSLTRSASSEIIKLIIDRLFILALVAMVLGFVGYILLNQSQSGNRQAGRDVIVEQIDKEKSILEVTKVGFTHNAEFDVMVRNLGDRDLIIHKITITKLKAPGIAVSPILEPTAQYHIPVGDIPLWGSKSIDVSHVVYANSVDRFSIALHTTTVYTLKVTFEYNEGKAVSFTRRIW